MKHMLLVILTSLLISCGGGSSSSNTPPASNNPPTNNTAETLTGIFVDARVEGLGYRTATQDGFTDANGSFEYLTGEAITFYIGDIDFPTVAADTVITPLTLFDTMDANDTALLNGIRLIQSLDADGNPDNGISISSDVHTLAQGISIDFDDADFATMVEILLDSSITVNGQLIDSADALAHLQQFVSLETGCTKLSNKVGLTIDLISRAHAAAGTIEIVDDCTIDIHHFSYEGGGLPDVYFYSGLQGDFESGVSISENIFGQVFTDEEFRISLSNMTVDDFDSISLWCVGASVSFADVMF